MTLADDTGDPRPSAAHRMAGWCPREWCMAPPTVKNRVHLDLRPYPGDDQAAEVARLRALGAPDIDLGQGDVPWTCLADPEGNEFDVLTPALKRSLFPV
ncbi:MAG: VOC family protein [Streptosporangiaceae bacterium]